MADPFKELESQGADPFAALEKDATNDPFAQLESSIPGYTESAIRGAAQGLTFNMADEATGLAEMLAAKAAGDTRSMSDLYTKFRDESRTAYEAAERANPKTYLASNIASGVALPGAGWLAGGKTLATAARAGAAAGALSGFGAAEGDVTKQITQAATSGAIGAAAGGVLHGAIKGVGALLSRKASQEAGSVVDLVGQANKVLDTIPDNVDDAIVGNDPMFMRYVIKTRGTPETVEQAFKKIDSNASEKELADAVGAALDNHDQFTRIIEQFSPEKRKELYSEFRNATALTKAAKDSAKEYLRKTRVVDRDPVQGGMAWIRPVNFNAQRVDAKAGSDFTGVVLDTIEAENTLATAARPYLKRALDVETKMQDAAKQAGQTFDDYSRDLYLRITQGKYKKGGVEDDIVKFFDDAREDLNKNYGLNIQEFKPYGKQTVYLPRTRMDMGSMQLKLDRAADRFYKGEMGDKEAKHFWDAMTYLGNELGEAIDNEADYSSVKKFIETKLVPAADREGVTNPLEASAAFARNHDIPPYIVERDLPKLMSNYINGNMKAGLYQVPMARMSAQIQAARDLGMNKTAEYFQKLQNNLLGSPSGTKAAMQARAAQWRLQGQRTLDDATTPIGKMQGLLQKVAPDFLPWSMGNMYTNLLGLNPYSALRNLTQPVMSGSTDIAASAGAPYASKITAQAFKDLLAVRGNLSGKSSAYGIGLASEGPIKNHVTDALVKGLQESGIPKEVVSAVRGYDKLAQGLMALYGEADKINRAWTMHMADRVVNDLVADNSSAHKLLSDLPAGIQNRITTALKHNDQASAVRELRKYFNVKHQYSYTNADMSQLGREYGSMFTAFTKFPVSILSDVEHQVYSKGLAGAFPITTKYLFPLAALTLVDNYTKNQRENMSPQAKLLFGDKLTDLSPLLGAVVQPPPLVSAGYKVATEIPNAIKDIADLEPEDMPARMKQAGVRIIDAVSPYIPGYGMYRSQAKRFKRAGIIESDEE